MKVCITRHVTAVFSTVVEIPPLRAQEIMKNPEAYEELLADMCPFQERYWIETEEQKLSLEPTDEAIDFWPTPDDEEE